MMTISIKHALSIWADLEAAFYNKSTYAGDTTEIYIYRAMSYTPILGKYGGIDLDKEMSPDSESIFASDLREAYDNANQNLHDLFVEFTKVHDGAKIEVEGRKLGPWLKTARFTHRVHVQIRPNK